MRLFAFIYAFMLATLLFTLVFLSACTAVSPRNQPVAVIPCPSGSVLAHIYIPENQVPGQPSAFTMSACIPILQTRQL